ncbi:DUF6988 family protein [Pseudoxanthomonas mexicana]
MNSPPSVEDYAAHIAATLNQFAAQGTRLSIPAGLPDRYQVVWAELRFAFDNAAAITSLLHHHGAEFAGPAFALLRPMNEALKRGTWIAFCASDDEIHKFVTEDVLPKRNLAADIEKIPPFDQFPMFSQQYVNAWDKFHSFTHAGSQIVGAYTMGEGIGPAFPENDIRAMLDHVEAIACMAIQVMVMIAGDFDRDRANEVLTELDRIKPANTRLAGV